MSGGPLYEKSVLVDAERVDEFIAWLEQHLADAETFAGVRRVTPLDTEPEDDDRSSFAWRYEFENDESLDVFLEREANESYPGAEQTFGDAVDVSRRVFKEDAAYAVGDGNPSACLNCGAVLRGQYCGNCGQRARSRLISLWELLRDAFGDLFELDSRLWRTVTPLLVRPGLLTADYLAGRRARYMPPFRMYLVLSLVFFLIAFFNPREELSLLYAPDTEEQTASDSGEDEGDTVRIPEEAREDLEQAGLDIDELNARLEEAEGEDEEEEEEDDDGINITINGDDPDEEGCELGDWDVSDMPEWFRVRFSRERLEAACTRTFKSEEGQQEFLRKMIDNIPLALFILLPLMALVQVFLYPLSRRYYVEHLLFFVHFHAFFFLMLTLQILWGRLVQSLGGPNWLGVLPIVAASFYIPVYLFKAMRRVYEQGWFLTFFKYLLLLVAYLFGFAFIMLFAFLFALAGS